jgi:hypothetical protein
LPASDVLQVLVTIALMVDAFILGATWQLMSDPAKRKNIFKRFTKPQKVKIKSHENLLAEP